MRKLFIWLLIAVFVVSMAFMGIGCKKAEEIAVPAAEEEEVATAEEEEVAEEAAPAEEEEVAKEETVIDELVVGMVADQGTSDMFKEHGIEGLMMKQLIYNGLTELDKNFNVVPGLAESWDISEDGTVYTFHLRKGVKFHNGREMTAEDVKWTYEAFLEPETGYSYLGDFQMISNIEVIDDYTIKLTIDEPYSSFLAGIASGVKPILAKESYVEGEGGLLELDKIIGTGPYKFVEWEPDDHIKLEAFDDYWAGTPNVKKITFKIVPDETVRFSALQAGDVDIIRSPSSVDLVAEMENPSSEDHALDVMDGTQYLTANLTFNNVSGPLTDKRVRQAIVYAVDVDMINKTINKSTGQLANGCWPIGNVWESGIPNVTPDLEKAKELLADAGYADGLDLVCLATNTYDMDEVGEIVQAQLAEIGIHLTVEVAEIARYFDRESRMDWDIKCGCHSISVDPTVLWNLVLRTGSPANWWMGDYNSPKIDALLDKAELTTDLAERQKIYKDIYQILMDDAGNIWTYNLPVTYGYRTEFQGIDFNARGDFIFDNDKGMPWITKIAK